MATKPNPKKSGKAKAAPTKSNSNLIAIGVGVLVLLVAGYALNGYLVKRRTALEPIEILEGRDDPKALLAMATGLPIGNNDAPVKIWEFLDYSCSHCKEFHEVIQSRIELQYLQTGKAQMIVYDYPLPVGPHSFLAARAARCAGDQGKYFEYGDLLFDNQAIWAPSPSIPVGTFVDYAQQLGLDTGEFKGCVQSDKHADVVSANRMLGDQLGVSGTPSVYVQRSSDRTWRYIRNPVYDSIAAVVDSLTLPLANVTVPRP